MAIDATVGGAAADSYLTVAAADALNASQLGDQAARWTAASTDEKEKALKMATVDIDAFVRSGAVWDDDQTLRFPRAVDVIDTVPFLPAKVQRATYEQATYLLVNQERIEEAATRRARQLFSFSEDNLSGSMALNPSTGLLSPQAELLLTGFVSVAGATAGRIGSVRVRSRYAQPTYVTQS